MSNANLAIHLKPVDTEQVSVILNSFLVLYFCLLSNLGSAFFINANELIRVSNIIMTKSYNSVISMLSKIKILNLIITFLTGERPKKNFVFN